MEGLDLSDATLDTLSDSAVVTLAEKIGMTLPSRGELRKDKIRRFQIRRATSLATTRYPRSVDGQVHCKDSRTLTTSIDTIQVADR